MSFQPHRSVLGNMKNVNAGCRIHSSLRAGLATTNQILGADKKMGNECWVGNETYVHDRCLSFLSNSCDNFFSNSSYLLSLHYLVHPWVQNIPYACIQLPPGALSFYYTDTIWGTVITSHIHLIPHPRTKESDMPPRLS